MQLLFKQRLFSWFDSYDIYDADGAVVYTVKGELAWGHRLNVYDAEGQHVATVQEKFTLFVPKFELYVNDAYVGEIRKEFTFLTPVFTLDCNDWRVEGDFFEYEYYVNDSTGEVIMQAEKKFFNFTDTYVIDIPNPDHALLSLMIVLAIDAVKCSNN